MSYKQALEAAGAEVLAFQEFGSYQGEWFALVNYNGEKQWINGWYGSCSGCDAFEAEFGYGAEECDEHRYNRQDDCEDCKAKSAEYQQKLADFGRTYLVNGMTQQEIEKQAGQNSDWDGEATAMVEFVKANAIPYAEFNLKTNDRS